MNNKLVSAESLVPTNICHKLVLCTVFYREIKDIEAANKALRELLSSSFPEILTRKGVKVFSNTERSTCVSVCETFMQMRSNRSDLDTIQKEFDDVVSIIYSSPQYFTILGITLRFIDVVNFGETINPIDALNKVYLAGIGKAKDLFGMEIEATSMKFYFTENYVPYELDVGPYLIDPDNVYVELESRREKLDEASDFLRFWKFDTQLMQSTIDTMVSRIVIIGVTDQR